MSQDLRACARPTELPDAATAPVVGAGVGALAGAIMGGASMPVLLGSAFGAGVGFYLSDPERVADRVRRAAAPIRDAMQPEERVLSHTRLNPAPLSILPETGSQFTTSAGWPMALFGVGAIAGLLYWASRKSASDANLMPRPIPANIGHADTALTPEQRTARDAQYRPFALAAQAQLNAVGFPTAGAAPGVFDRPTLDALVLFGQSDANRLQQIQDATPNQTAKALDLLDREYRRARNLPQP